MAGVAEAGPLLVVMDDAHWLDQSSAEALAFMGRRLLAEGIVLLLSRRAGEGDECGDEQPEAGTQVGGMHEEDGAGQAADYEDVGPNQRRTARVEEAQRQEDSLDPGIYWG